MANSPSVDGWTKEQEQMLGSPQIFDLEDMEEVRVNAMERAKACAKNAMAKRRAAAKEWAAAAMSQGAKLAHGWTGIGAKPQLAEEVISRQKTHESTQDTVTAVQEVRVCAKASQVLPKIMLKDLDDALATVNEATGMGADRFGPRFIKPPT